MGNAAKFTFKGHIKIRVKCVRIEEMVPSMENSRIGVSSFDEGVMLMGP